MSGRSSVAVSYFFFSSRRRHTRLQGDWSSDVCSSDLREKCFEAGMDGYVSKPIQTDLLKSEITRLSRKGSGEQPMNTVPHKFNGNGPAGAVNLPELLARVENDWDLLREIAGIFREEFPRYTTALRVAIRDGNLENAREAAHALKGMLANLAAGRASDGAGEMAQLAKRGEQ